MHEYILAFDGLVWMAHKVMEKFEFLHGETDLLLAAAHHARGGIKHQVLNFKLFGECLRWSAVDRTHTRLQFIKREWFYQVIIGAAIKCRYFIFNTIAPGKNEDGDRNALFA